MNEYNKYIGTNTARYSFTPPPPCVTQIWLTVGRLKADCRQKHSGCYGSLDDNDVDHPAKRHDGHP